MKLKCDTCGELDYVLVDGYPFGDRLLEGVMFKVEDKNGKPHTIGVIEEAKEYFSDFNEKKWLRACDEFCLTEDLATCPKCQGEVPIWGANQKPQQTGHFTIGKTRIEDILKLNT